jgi:HAMP domain-containing protein
MSFHLPSVFMSLRSHLLTFILLAVIPSFGVIVYSANQHRQLAANQAQRNALGAARAIAAEQERFFENAHQFLVMLARVPQIRETNTISCNKFLAGLLEPLYADLGLVDRHGNLRCSALPPEKSLLKPSGAHHKRAVETHDYSVGEIRVDKATGRAFADLAFPLADSPGALRGALVATLDLSWITQITAQKHLYPGASFTLLDGRGNVLFRYPPNREGNLIFTLVREQKKAFRDTERTVEIADADGMARLFAFSRLKSPVGGQSAYVAVDLPTATAFADADRILLYDLFLLGLLAALILTLAWCAADVFVLRRIQDIMDATRRVASGTLSARTKIPYGLSELGQLARTFDELAHTLEKRNAEVHASAQKIHEQRQRQSALYDINLAITSTLDLASVLRILLKEIAAQFPSCGASVAWINGSTSALEQIAQHNLDSAEEGQSTPAPEMGLPLVVLSRQAPIAIPDARIDPRVINPEFFRFHHFISYLGLPMIAKDETLGCSPST